MHTAMTTDKTRRRELLAGYKQAGPAAGIYGIRNRLAGKVLVGSTMNLGSMRGKLEFARSTGSSSVLDKRLHEAIATDGLDSFELEVLEELEIRPQATPVEIASDLATLETLWREKFNPAELY
jgi:hypothetical protein